MMPFDVPIIGQPTVGDWCLTVQIICTCKTPVLLVGQVGSRSACRSCRTIYQLTGLPVMNNGAVAIPLGIAVGARDADAG